MSGNRALDFWATSGRTAGQLPGHDAESIARSAHFAACNRLGALAGAPGVDVRRGAHWLAVRTGAASNDLNGVVSGADVEITEDLVADLTAYFSSADVPASWLTEHAEPSWTRVLEAAKARPERTGHWSGRAIGPIPTVTSDVQITRVSSSDDLERWLDVAATCGWLESADDRGVRRGLYTGLGFDHPQLSHWLALVQNRPVGFASAFVDRDVVDLCNLGVAAAWRRRGIGTALVAARLRHAANHYCRIAVSAPSPDGWALQRKLGFHSVPVIADTCFYMPTA